MAWYWIAALCLACLLLGGVLAAVAIALWFAEGWNW